MRSDRTTDLRLIVMMFCRLRGRIFSSDSMFNQSRSPRTTFGIVDGRNISKGSGKENEVGAARIDVVAAEEKTSAPIVTEEKNDGCFLTGDEGLRMRNDQGRGWKRFVTGEFHHQRRRNIDDLRRDGLIEMYRRRRGRCWSRYDGSRILLLLLLLLFRWILKIRNIFV